MNKDRFNNIQESYDNMEAPFDEGYQTKEEIDKENEQELKYYLLIDQARSGDNAAKGYEAFYDAIASCDENIANLLFDMIITAADYNGSEATVPDFVRLVRMAFEWKSKQ